MTNKERADRALEILMSYGDREDAETSLIDLLSDLRHCCARFGPDEFDHALAISEVHYNAERKEQTS